MVVRTKNIKTPTHRDFLDLHGFIETEMAQGHVEEANGQREKNVEPKQPLQEQVPVLQSETLDQNLRLLKTLSKAESCCSRRRTRSCSALN
jgi:hypothetical protein